MAEEHKGWESLKIETREDAVARLRWLADMIEEHGLGKLSLTEEWEPPKWWKRWDDTWLLDFRAMIQVNDTLTPEMIEVKDGDRQAGTD